jgi:DNA-binding MarR family transcriptional regulator
MSARRKPKEPEVTAAAASFHVADWPMHYLLAIVRCHVRNMGMVLLPFECGPLVWRVLSIVCERERCSIGQLAEISVIERSNLSRIVDGMERDGLVAKVGHVRDKRQTRVAVTAKGRALFARSLPAVLDYYRQFLGGISPDERTVFMRVLKKVERNVCGAPAELVDW